MVGTVLGWLLAGRLVTALGPSPDLDAGAPGQAALTAALALVAGLALLGLVAGLRARNATERPVGARRSRLALVPWELLLLGGRGSPATWRCASGRPVVLVENVAQVNLLVVAFPLLFILGGVGAGGPAARAAAAAAGRPGRPAAGGLVPGRPPADRVPAGQRRAAGRGQHPGGDDRVRRRADHRLPTTLDAKARVFAGSEVAVTDHRPRCSRTAADRPGRHRRAPLPATATVGGTDVAVLAVDPDTLAAAAYWRADFAAGRCPTCSTGLPVRRPAAGCRRSWSTRAASSADRGRPARRRAPRGWRQVADGAAVPGPAAAGAR